MSDGRHVENAKRMKGKNDGEQNDGEQNDGEQNSEDKGDGTA
jgi:hypothetical protein